LYFLRVLRAPKLTPANVNEMKIVPVATGCISLIITFNLQSLHYFIDLIVHGSVKNADGGEAGSAIDHAYINVEVLYGNHFGSKSIARAFGASGVLWHVMGLW
jgi:hypothetical protein